MSAYAITHSYVQDFGNVKLAVVERQVGPKAIKTATEVLQGEATSETWKRLEAVLNETQNWLEAS